MNIADTTIAGKRLPLTQEVCVCDVCAFPFELGLKRRGAICDTKNVSIKFKGLLMVIVISSLL